MEKNLCKLWLLNEKLCYFFSCYEVMVHITVRTVACVVLSLHGAMTHTCGLELEEVLLLLPVPKKSRMSSWLQKLLGASLMAQNLEQPVCNVCDSFGDFLTTSIFPGVGALPCLSSLPSFPVHGRLSHFVVPLIKSTKRKHPHLISCYFYFLLYIILSWLFLSCIMCCFSLHSPRQELLVTALQIAVELGWYICVSSCSPLSDFRLFLTAILSLMLNDGCVIYTQAPDRPSHFSNRVFQQLLCSKYFLLRK